MSVTNELKDKVRSFFDSKKEELIRLGTWFWQNPESGYREEKTSAMAVRKLREMGLEVKTGLGITGFRAEVDTGRPGPAVAVLGELDSLIIPSHPECDPKTGAVHACGHNAILMGMLGTAMAITQGGFKDKLCGKIVFIGCPAEEGIEMGYRLGLIKEGRIHCISGKAQLIMEGVFDDIDIAFMNHPGSSFCYVDHNGCVKKRIVFTGKSCHASTPENGRNALNAANLALHAIGLFRESYSYTDKIRIHGIISEGGNTVNVIPDHVVMEYQLRAPTVKEITELNDRFDHIVLHAAMAAECEAESTTVNGSLPLKNNDELGQAWQDAVSIVAPDADIQAKTYFSCACTDMGDVSSILPAIHGYIPGAGGTSHGKDYCIPDPAAAYVNNAMVETLMLIDLLSGDAEKGRKIAAQKKDCMPLPEYKKLIRSLNRVKKSAGISHPV